MSNLMAIYQRLFNYYGVRNWWPAKTPFEVVVGAILTQNTNWKNVEQALNNLRQANALSPEAMRQLPTSELEILIRPSGFFRQKSERLKLFCHHLQTQHQDQLDTWLEQEFEQVRNELLSLKGIGPETADSIMLYAGQRLTFVVDAYTSRIFNRLGLLNGKEKYAEIRDMFMLDVESDVQIYNEYHALIVIHCKNHCRKKPLCQGCPLADICKFEQLSE
jgi:endonuclease III related protein